WAGARRCCGYGAVLLARTGNGPGPSGWECERRYPCAGAGMTSSRVEPAGSLDVNPLCALLAAAQLPTEGFGEHLQSALVARDAAEILGCVALERYGNLALLRLLVVTPCRRGEGVGQQLTRTALDLARQHRVVAVYLLTAT